MIDGYATAKRVCPGKWRGLFYQAHPTPTGGVRHVPRFATWGRYPSYRAAKSAVTRLVGEATVAETGKGIA